MPINPFANKPQGAKPNPLLDAFAGQNTNPFAAGQPKPRQQQQQQQARQPAAPEPAELPDGARGLDPNTGQPIFDNTLSGVLKKWKWNFTKDVQDVDESAWDDLKARWKTAAINELQAQGTVQKVKTGFAGSQVIGEAIAKGYQDITASSQGSIFAPILKGTNATISSLGDLFSLGSQKTEQSLGAIRGLREVTAEVAAEDNPLVPRLDGNFEEFANAVPGLSGALESLRFVLSPSANKWERAKQGIEEGWQSGRILYSQVLDPALKQEFVRRYRNGEDPSLLAMELQNPLAEMVGQLVLDPLNLVGAFGKSAKVARELDAAHDALTASNVLKTERGVEAFKAIQAAEDETSAVKALSTLADARMEANAAMRGSSKLLNVGYGINDLTTTSRQNAIASKGKTLLGNMALVLRENGMSYDAVAEAVLYGAKSVSENAEVVKEGLAGLSHLPNANMWLSDDYAETFTVVRNLLEGEGGILTGAKLEGLMQISNPAQFAEEATKLLRTAATTQFPDVSELGKAAELAGQAAKTGGAISTKTAEMAKAYEALPNHVKYLNKINEQTSKVKNFINKPLGWFYFNLQGGVAVKNVVSNNELILIDKGIGAWFKDGKYWSTEGTINFIKDIYGELPEAAHGFKSLVSATTESKPFLFGKWMEKGEEAGAARVVAASIRDTFKKMIPAAMPDLAKEVQAGVLTQKQANKLGSLILKNNGNLERALGEFRELYKLGAVEAWRNLDFVSDFERDGLQGLGYWDEIEELATKGANSQAEVEQVFEKIRKSIDARAELATQDVIGLSADHPSAETWGDLMKAVEDGHLDPGQHQVFTALMESAEQARLEYQNLLDDVAMKAMDVLSGGGKAEEARHIGQEMNRVRQVLRRAGPATAKETRTITADAWRWSDAIKAEKRPTPEFLRSMWTRAGLNGDAPLDLDKGVLLKELWKQRFEKVSAAWNSSFNAIVGESETILKQMGKVVDTSELDAMAARTRHITQQTQALRSAVFDGKALRIHPAEDVAYVAGQYGVQPSEILQAINNNLPAGARTFQKIEDVPTRQVMDILEQVRQRKGLPKLAGVTVPPPHALGSQPSLPRAWNESARGAKYTLDRIRQEILSRWGQTDEAMQVSTDLENVLSRVQREMTPRIAETKAIALRIAEQQREFTLLNYGKKTYGDVALSYILPYHFFYTRSYKNWISRVATNPEILAGYGIYKNFLEQQNKDLPEWYRQQIDVTKMLGIQTDHPLFLNLEATFNPLYGLTGTDFNDPAKRTNAVTASIDDMGKFGPTIWAPIQMAIAAKLFMDGDKDAASRWGSRLVPETAQIKAVSSMFGKPIELDPAVNFFSGGIDPYERGRMGYAAAQLIRDGRYTPEQIQEQFQMQAGPAWDEAYQLAIQSRAASSISSYFLGVGFKPRSTNDVTVEAMYTDLNHLWAVSDTMSSQDFKEQYEAIRSSYPEGMMDTVLLAKKGGDKRDSAYAYSVLGRLPPGEMSDVFKAIGISPQDVSKFYDSKGFTDKSVKWTPTEKQRFMAAIVDLGAMLKIPDEATRTEWNDARSLYSETLEVISNQLGVPYEKDARGKVLSNGIWDEVSHYYDLKDDNPDAADAFKAQHPEVIQALQLKGGYISGSPLLSAYYGGIDTIEAYLSGKVRQQLEDKYGPAIYDIQNEYYNTTNQRAYLRQHPELKRFWTDKANLDQAAEQMFFEFGAKLPNPRSAQMRADFTPSSGVQETLYNELQPQASVPAWQDVSQGMPEWLQQEVAAHAFEGQAVSTRAQKELDFLAKGQGFYDWKDLLRTASLSLQYGASQPPQNQNPFAVR